MYDGLDYVGVETGHLAVSELTLGASEGLPDEDEGEEEEGEREEEEDNVTTAGPWVLESNRSTRSPVMLEPNR